MSSLQVSRLFSDHAVLCRNKEIRIFGQADDKAQITAALHDAAGVLLAEDTVIAEKNAYLLRLPPQVAQTDCTLTVSDGAQCVTFSDIAIGDVFLANGQSNMELELQNADEGQTLLQVHSNPMVRFYNVPKFARDGSEADRANQNACWQSIAPGVGADMSAAAYFFAMKLQPKIDVPVGIIDCYWGGTSITCWMDEDTLQSTAEGRRYAEEYREKSAGKTLDAYLEEERAFMKEMEDWGKAADQIKAKQPNVTPQELNKLLGPFPWHPPVGCGSPYRPCGLFDTMLRRILPVTLTGVLYYQGEEDTWRTAHYDILLSSYIFMLRRLFKDPALPFINVQLPMWIDAGAEDSKQWPRLRAAQDTVFKNVRNTGLVVLLDEGEYDNIHPTNKRVVGERLYEEALRLIYRQPAPQAVFVSGHYRKDHRLIIQLTDEVFDAGSGEWLMEVAGADGRYFPAQAELDGCMIRLSSPDVPRPEKARYAWTDYAIVRLKGLNGLPLAPFVID